MFKSKQNNGISKVRPNGDTPLSITPTPMGDAPRPSDWAIQAEKERKLKSEQRAEMEDKRKRMKSNKSQELESYLMEQAESKKKNK
jgi:2-methylcitrate dehydratase PrpD